MFTQGSANHGRRVIGALVGGLAGAAGVWAMDRVGWRLYDRESSRKRQAEHRARVGGKDVAHAAVDRIRGMRGKRPKAQPNRYGLLLHYGLGVLPGALYALTRLSHPWITAGNGALYGAALFVLMDEGLAPVARVAAPPTAYPLQAHARGLASHVVLGVVTELLLRLTDHGRRKRN